MDMISLEGQLLIPEKLVESKSKQHTFLDATKTTKELEFEDSKVAFVLFIVQTIFGEVKADSISSFRVRKKQFRKRKYRSFSLLHIVNSTRHKISITCPSDLDSRLSVRLSYCCARGGLGDAAGATVLKHYCGGGGFSPQSSSLPVLIFLAELTGDVHMWKF